MIVCLCRAVSDRTIRAAVEGVPNLQRPGKVSVGETVPEQFTLDLAVGAAAIKALNVLRQTGEPNYLAQQIRDDA